MLRTGLAVSVALALMGCAPMAPPVSPLPEGPVAGGGGSNDCAVIAAVAKEHYRFNTTDNRPPPIRFDGDYDPRCDWSRYGLAFDRYDPDAPGDPRQRVRWVSFGQPVYDGRGATVATGIMHGPLAGTGSECRVVSGFAGWTVPERSCRMTWIS